jgi:hypothetical protein
VTITGFGASGVNCASGYAGIVCATQFGDQQTVSIQLLGATLLALCHRKQATVFGSAVATVTITHFGPNCVNCTSGFAGIVYYAVCGSVGSEYSVSGCEATDAYMRADQMELEMMRSPGKVTSLVRYSSDSSLCKDSAASNTESTLAEICS